MSSQTRRAKYARFRSAVDLVGGVAMIGAAVFLVWVNWPAGTEPPEPPVPKEPVSLEGAQLRGNNLAKFAILEYSDFECPFCSRFAQDVFPAIDQTYIATGRLLFAFRHLPLEARHPNALKAAQASQCAAETGRFWPMHEQLFVNPKELATEHLMAKARTVGLDMRQFERCLAGDTAADSIRADVRQAMTYGITGTPAFLFGELTPDRTLRVLRVQKGALPLAEFRAAIEALLTRRS